MLYRVEEAHGRMLGLIAGCQGVKIPSKFHSTNEMLYLLEAVFICKPVFWLLYRLGLQRKFWKNGEYIKASQGRKCCSAERLVELYSLTVIINSGTQKKVAPLCAGTKHCQLNLIVVAVILLQLDSDFKIVELFVGDGITYTEMSVTIRIFEFY